MAPGTSPNRGTAQPERRRWPNLRPHRHTPSPPQRQPNQKQPPKPEISSTLLKRPDKRSRASKRPFPHVVTQTIGQPHFKANLRTLPGRASFTGARNPNPGDLSTRCFLSVV